MKPQNGAMTIGAAAKRAGVKIDTIRYYERRGLLAKPDRNLAGYRTFNETTVQRLRFIKRVQELGFTLNETKQLLTLRITPGTTCVDVRRKAEKKIADIGRKIRSLNAMQSALRELVSACTAEGPASECSLLATLGGELR
jgi:MerR family transcriptional regulator, copper efflux regulator